MPSHQQLQRTPAAATAKPDAQHSDQSQQQSVSSDSSSLGRLIKRLVKSQAKHDLDEAQQLDGSAGATPKAILTCQAAGAMAHWEAAEKAHHDIHQPHRAGHLEEGV